MQVKLTITEKGKHNRKVGPIPVSTTTSKSCPDCPLKGGNGCYAEGQPVKGVWDNVTSGKWGTDWATFCDQIAALKPGQPWRHNQAGDLPGNGNRIDAPKLRLLVHANAGKLGWTYTHKPTGNASNRKAIAEANRDGFTVNLSANNLAHADKLAAQNIGPVVVVIDRPEGQRYDDIRTPQGRRVVTCPATYREQSNCANCLLCARPNRTTIVGFPAHGNQKKAAAAIARG